MSKEKDSIINLGKIEIDMTKGKHTINADAMPILPTRDLVLFPGVTFPIHLGRQSSIDTARYAADNHVALGVVCQLDDRVDEPDLMTDLSQLGVVADVVRILELPGAPITALVRARDKIQILAPSELPDTSVNLAARVKLIHELHPRKSDTEFLALSDAIKDTTLEMLKAMANAPADLTYNIREIPSGELLVNYVATNAPISSKKKMELLGLPKVKPRAERLLDMLKEGEQLMSVAREIGERTSQALSQQQRNAFLQQQMESIRQELYGEEGPEADIDRLRKKAAELPLPDDVRTTFDRECSKLGRIAPQSPDYSVLLSYLELLTELPWGKEDTLNRDIAMAEQTLDSDHYGLEKVKERILEQIALLINAPEGHAPILCLVGAPGVGKTSLGQSIARALGRKYKRVALGGLHDEAEIRGHRRTYIGAMPGRIIDAMRRCGTSNPVMLLDEIDKIGSDFKGDPSAALLEVLDPEQNCRFHDNYVDVDFDLSKVLFIATANTLSSIPSPLLDRMEIIEISGYLPEEKIEIAKRHLLPRLIKEAGLDSSLMQITDEAILAIIETYTSESGVRQFEKKLASLVRKVVLRKVSDKSWPRPIEPAHLNDLLGPAPFVKDEYEDNRFAGVVTGLAWTAAGGCVLCVEASFTPGKGEKLTLTGNLGDVMKESATIALQHVRANLERLGIAPDALNDSNLHIHVPEGAIPKDGPSAGITMATAIVSALTGRKVRQRLAMTGELTLRGRVLPIGGVKEKILAAKRAGVTDVILPEANRKDVEVIPAHYLTELNIHYVKEFSEVADFAILPELA